MMMLRMRCVICITVCVLWVWGIPDAHAWVVGLGGQLYSDDGALDGVKRIGPSAPRDEDRDFFAASFTSLSLYALSQEEGQTRYGGGLRFYGNYGILDDIPEDQVNPDEPRPSYEVGTKLELYTQLEWIIPLLKSKNLDILVGTQFGLGLIFPGKDFTAEIEAEQEDGASVWNVPRLGVLFGPQVGARYAIIKKKLSARFDVGIRYDRYFLFATAEEIEGVAYSKNWTMNMLRYEASLGLELVF